MHKEYLGKTKNNIAVYVDTKTAHAMTHFAHQPKLRGTIEQIIPTIVANSKMIRIERDLGEEIGTTDLVATTEGDEIVYALRPHRKVYSRFVKHKQPVPSSWVTIVLRKTGDEYSLYTAFVGRNTPSFPGGDYLPDQSVDFWSRHALVWGSQEVIPCSETSECPW